jgi:hypothetical protein
VPASIPTTSAAVIAAAATAVAAMVAEPVFDTEALTKLKKASENAPSGNPSNRSSGVGASFVNNYGDDFYDNDSNKE